MKVQKIVGWILIGLVVAPMLLAGTAKVLGQLPAEEVEKMGLTDEIQMIGFGCLASGILLAIPKTCSIGVLLVSSYWGGAICTHMIKGDSYLVPAILLSLTWIGTTLRDNRLLWSFQRDHASSSR